MVIGNPGLLDFLLSLHPGDLLALRLHDEVDDRFEIDVVESAKCDR